MKNSTRSLGKEIIINELKKRGFNVAFQNRVLVLNNRLTIDFKTCNRDNEWAKNNKHWTNYIGGFDGIDSSKFDYLICVSFDGNFEKRRFFIFSKKETEKFPVVVWKDGKSKGFKTINLCNDDESADFIKSSENKWDKLCP